MEEKDQEPMNPPGLQEALHPEIGNGAAWAKDPHQFLLLSVDPLHPLDNLILDRETRQSIIESWTTDYADSADTADTAAKLTINKKHKDKSKKKSKKLHSSKRNEDPAPGWLGSEEEHQNAVSITKDFTPADDSTEEGKPLTTGYNKPEPPEGKRVRKALKKARKAEENMRMEAQVNPAFSLESNLSPFTRWLKGLKGSEYIHPYEDDYALDHMAATTKDGISETFADLLAAQGFRERAIEMYKLLIAKYPEKSSFFAAKIEALK